MILLFEFKIGNTDLILNKAILQIWQIEKYSYKSSARPDYGFLYLSKGVMTYSFDDQLIKLTAGDIIYLPKGSNYEANFDIKTSIVENVLINFDVVGAAGFSEINKPVLIFNDKSKNLSQFFYDIVNTYNENGKSFLTYTLMYKCFYEIQKALQSQNENKEQTIFNQIASLVVEKPELSVEEVCTDLHMSRSMFQQKFKLFMGSSPVEYRTKKRIEKAKLLLETTDIPIKEIVEMLGFYDAAYFYKVFEKSTSLTPKQYRDKSNPLF